MDSVGQPALLGTATATDSTSRCTLIGGIRVVDAGLREAGPQGPDREGRVFLPGGDGCGHHLLELFAGGGGQEDFACRAERQGQSFAQREVVPKRRFAIHAGDKNAFKTKPGEQ